MLRYMTGKQEEILTANLK